MNVEHYSYHPYTGSCELTAPGGEHVHEPLNLVTLEQYEAAEQRITELEADNRRLREALEFYGTHDTGCVAGQWRQGRSTKDGGYEMLYGFGKNEKWYQRGEMPPCTCGLDATLKE